MEDLLWILDRQWPPERCMKKRKHRGVRADAEGECEDGHGGEAGTLAQHTEGVARVLQECFDDGQAVEFAIGFFQLCEASQPHASSALGFFWRHASPDIFVREHFEMDLKFILEVLIRVVG